MSLGLDSYMSLLHQICRLLKFALQSPRAPQRKKLCVKRSLSGTAGVRPVFARPIPNELHEYSCIIWMFINIQHRERVSL
jgi:hypothetical protein